MTVKFLTQEHNTMSPARAQTRTARSGEERTNNEATADLHEFTKYLAADYALRMVIAR